MMQNETITVPGMSCEHCKRAIANILKESGVKSEFDLLTKHVSVEFDDALISKEEIIAAIRSEGYESE